MARRYQLILILLRRADPLGKNIGLKTFADQARVSLENQKKSISGGIDSQQTSIESAELAHKKISVSQKIN